MVRVTATEDLVAAVEAAFEVTSRGLASWADPHADRSPLDEEYSRVSDPAKWRIVGARADAWMVALEGAELAGVERDVGVRWREPAGPTITSTDRLVPHVAGALPLVVARSRIEDVDDAGLTLGVGDPAQCITWIPECGCDACDSGSDNELAVVDAHVLGVVTGAFRRLSRDDRSITILGDDGWSASGLRSRDVGPILANPKGWRELSGRSWLDR
jgi:hypothetical protein